MGMYFCFELGRWVVSILPLLYYVFFNEDTDFYTILAHFLILRKMNQSGGS